MVLDDKNVAEWLGFWHAQRHLARTDLLWFCHNVLGYNLIRDDVHGPILDTLQHFPGADEFHKTAADFADAMNGKIMWRPKVMMQDLEPNPGCVSGRQTLILFPRGHAKSTLATVAHALQWLINYPNVRILITTATETLVTSFIIQIRDHLRNNLQLRQLFPELVPRSLDGKIPELGNLSGFMLPGRDNANKWLGPGGKEQSVMASTVGSAITGYHGDVFKVDDAVEKINSSSQNGIEDVIRHIGSMGDLLEKYVALPGKEPKIGWFDMIGTPWDAGDSYAVIRSSEDERKEKGLPPRWNITVRSAAPNWPKGPFLYPELCGYETLKEIEDNPTKGPYQLSAQYLMNPIVAGMGLISDVNQLQWTPRSIMDQLLPRMSLVAAVDLAGMDQGSKGTDNDYTCLTVGGFANGRIYVPFMLHGRPPVEEVIEWIFRVFERFPSITKLKIEKEAHARVLLPFLRTEMSKRQRWLPIEATPRSNQQSKKDKIRGLRPWFQNGDIRFADDLPYKTAIINEVKGFPKFKHDDILDTITDLVHESRGITSGLLADKPREAWEQPVAKDPISLILAEHDLGFVDFWGQSVDSQTGFPD